MNLKERRQMLSRIRVGEHKKSTKELLRDDKTEAACSRVIGEVLDLTGETISRGLALRLVRGINTKVSGMWCRSAATGEVFAAKAPVRKSELLVRFTVAAKGRA